jgi:hypothetical protein
MDVNPKNIKKITKAYQKKVSDITKNCDKKKYKKVPDNELLEVLDMAKSINDKKEILNLYNNYRSFISDGVIKKIEDFLGIKKDKTKKLEPKQEEQPRIEPKPKSNDLEAARAAFNSFSYEPLDEIPEETKEILRHYKEEGFLFSVMKKYKVYFNEIEKRALTKLDEASPIKVDVFWSNETQIKVVVGKGSDKLTVIEALEKYGDNKYFMMHLNHLLGMYLYTPIEEYFDGMQNIEDKPNVRVLK